MSRRRSRDPRNVPVESRTLCHARAEVRACRRELEAWAERAEGVAEMVEAGGSSEEYRRGIADCFRHPVKRLKKLEEALS